MANYEISIAMATYQGGRYLRQQLESLKNQTLQSREIVICDDGSKDDTLSIIDLYKHCLNIQVYKNVKSIGVIRNFSRAISLCTSPYIALCDQDDVWVRDKLEKCMERMIAIEEYKKPALVFSDLEVVDENLEIINSSLWRHLNADPINETFYTLLFGNVVTGCSVLMNRIMAEYLREIPQQAIMHDHWAALIAFGFGRRAIIQEPLVKYRQHGKNITNNFERTLLNRTTAFIKTIWVKKNVFLLPELNQAQAFYNCFHSELSLEDKAHLEKFLAMRETSFWRKKWESFKSNHCA